MSSRSYLSIGDVLTLLRQEFPDVTISKIRFLESQGLVNPERTPSGYRKFYEHDVERLRWVLRQQREHFLPLKVIKDRLDDGGTASTAAATEEVRAPSVEEPVLVGQRTWTEGAEPPGGGGSHHRRVDEAPPAGLTDGPTLPGIEHAAAAGNGIPPSDGGGGTPSRSQRPPARPPAASTVPSPAATAAKGPAREPSPAPSQPPADALSAATGTSEGEPAAPATRRQRSNPPSATVAPSGGSGSTTGPEGDPVPSGTTPATPSAAGTRSEPATTPAGRHRGSRATAVPSEGPGAELPVPTGATLSMDDLAAASGLEVSTLEDLAGFGLLVGTKVAGQTYFDAEGLAVAKLAAGFARFGVEPRHLRLYKNAADREAGFVEQIVTPLVRQRNPEARARAHETVDELASLGQQLRASLLRSALGNLLDG